MSGRLAMACELVLRAAIQATQPGGRTHRYFEQQGHKEAAMRQAFAEHKVADDFDVVAVSEESAEILRHLSGFYGTRHDLKHQPDVYRILMEAVAVFGRRHRTTMTLLDSSDAERDEIHGVLVSAIARIKGIGSKQPYSLASKFLHFILPTTFAI